MVGVNVPPQMIEPGEALNLFRYARLPEYIRAKELYTAFTEARTGTQHGGNSELISLLSFVYDTGRVQGIREERAKRRGGEEHGETVEIQGRALPVVGHVRLMSGRECVGTLPIIPTMSDYHWQLECLNSRLEHPENYENREDLPAAIARLRAWLKEHEDQAPGKREEVQP